MQSKLIHKRVGVVEIFELIGDLSGNFAPICGRAIREILEKNQSRHILLNTEELYQIDVHGTQLILRLAEKADQCVVMAHDHYITDSIRLEDKNQKIPILDKWEACAFQFSREFAQWVKTESHPWTEKRRYGRLETALPLFLNYESEEGKSHSLFSVVTNLSEGGLYARFVESRSEKQLAELDVQDVQIVRLQLFLNTREILSLDGKVIHRPAGGGGVGVEFMELHDTTKIKIGNWVDQTGLLEKGRNHLHE
ncbi:MAG: PilZ domain-containing protein [Candidatus Omnitrophica bacterium]|nr:PilZ domain-containing protein [Candidatus Omnitrophota bacterium]